MNIIFAGTPLFAATALKALVANNHKIALVLTQPDRPAGRGMKMLASQVKQYALDRKLPVFQPDTLKSSEIHEKLKVYNADVMVVAAYGLILPAPVLDIPRFGCLNIHASLLPRWRGAAPIQRAILAGDQETGITIMKMDAGLDTGTMLWQKTLVIEFSDTAQTLHDKLSVLGAQCIVTALMKLEQGELVSTPQEDALASYAPKISKVEAAIDWLQDAKQINRMIRAFNPTPGAYTQIQGSILKIWQSSMVQSHSGQPGEILSVTSDGIVVACGRNALVLEMLQRPGSKKLRAAEFLSGYPLQPGGRFESVLHSAIHSKC